MKLSIRGGVHRSRQKATAHKGSQTAGKVKGENCQTNPTKRFFFAGPKAYKHPQYEQWHKLAKRLNSGEKSQT